jgi:hypothetical protein
MTTAIYAEAAGDESAALVTDDCDANTCFYCASPETD